ncbi:MAG: hypothetical protein CM15mP74_22480 [Halieaceae bacterium]|nr:MAG: hypothetical protein CM15mP74_22480 [Halieaceae bacterium]
MDELDQMGPISPGAQFPGFSGAPQRREIPAFGGTQTAPVPQTQTFDEAALGGSRRAFGISKIYVAGVPPRAPRDSLPNIGARATHYFSDTGKKAFHDQIYPPRPGVGPPIDGDTLPPEGGNTGPRETLYCGHQDAPARGSQKLDGCLANPIPTAF